jgi:hypothetical protein
VIDRRNRRDLALIGLLLMLAGTLAAALGAGGFGNRRANRDVFDPTVVGWWNEGGWKSFAVVTAIGVVAAGIGAALVGRQLHRNDGRDRTPNVAFPVGGSPGETTLRSPALSHNLETDLETIPDVTKATVGLFGHYPAIEMRAVLTVDDHVDLEQLPARVDDVLARMKTTAGVRPEPLQVTLRFIATSQARQLS